MPSYKSYNFKDKDPCIDILRTVLQIHEIDWHDIPEFSGVCENTYWGWFEGPTRTYRNETMMATLRVLPTEVQRDYWARVAKEQIMTGIAMRAWKRNIRLVA
jgi:hypothetical protein